MVEELLVVVAIVVVIEVIHVVLIWGIATLVWFVTIPAIPFSRSAAITAPVTVSIPVPVIIRIISIILIYQVPVQISLWTSTIVAANVPLPAIRPRPATTVPAVVTFL